MLGTFLYKDDGSYVNNEATINETPKLNWNKEGLGKTAMRSRGAVL